MKGDFTKAKEISTETKIAVLERQGYKSISGVSLYGKAFHFHHVRFKSDSGVGYEFNIVAITAEEHRLYHDRKNIKVNGRDRYTWQEFETLMRNHLKMNYTGWSLEACRYHKYFKEEDYGVIRCKQ